MDAKKDLGWLLIVFIGFGLLWYVGGGSEPQEKNDGAFLDMTGLFQERSSRKRTESASTTTLEIAKEIKDIEEELEQIERALEKTRKKEAQSSMYGYVSLSAPGAREPLNNEYLRLSVSSSLDDQMLISGLELYSPITGKSVKIGGAANIPQVGKSNIEEAIMASPGDVLYIYSARSPVGFSFRSNACTGYFSQFQDFNPPLKNNCPSPEDEARHLEAVEALGPSCLDYLDSLPRCRIITDPKEGISKNCRNFISSNLSYSSCLANHIQDTNFPGKEWRVYLRQSNDLWRKERDVIQLLDNAGKVIDAISY